MLAPPRKRKGFPSDDKLKRPTKNTKWDPLKIINAVNYSNFLRSEKEFTSSLDAAGKYNRDPSDDETPARDKKMDPARATRMRGRQRCDLVGMLLERREFKVWMKDDAIRSIHLYSDASPVVGVELQGMLIDVVLKNGEIVRRTLPGSQLSYGACGVASKGIAFLWAVFLTCGPERESLEYCMSKLVSATTDNGTEVNLVIIPDIMQQFYAWMRGTPIEEIKAPEVEGTRLMKETLRIIGFGHTTGGIMKEIAEADPDYPKYLEQMRTLCRFLEIGVIVSTSSVAFGVEEWTRKCLTSSRPAS